MTGQKRETVICNGCGRTLRMENGICREDFLEIRKKWGYFSAKDMEKHSFRLCEDCYDKLIQALTIPPQIVEDTEPLCTE